MLLIMNRFLDSALRAPLEMTEWTALRRIVTEIHEKAAAPVAFWLGTAAALI